MLDRFKRGMRMSKKNKQQPKTTTAGENIVPVVQEVGTVDTLVSKKMGLTKTKPFSTDRSLVNDMAAFANANGIKLPRWTSDPAKIAKAIAEHEEVAEDAD